MPALRLAAIGPRMVTAHGPAGGADRRARRRARRHRRRRAPPPRHRRGLAPARRAGRRRLPAQHRGGGGGRADLRARTGRRSCRSARARASRATSPRCEGGVSVDMTQMNAILRLSVEDMDVTVQAGVTRRQLDDEAAPRGRVLPVDPGADATLGGMVATGASGRPASATARCARTSSASPSSPPTARSCGPARGRASPRAGYDLTRLFIGCEGTLGLITEITLRVQPTPEAMTAAAAAFPTRSTPRSTP